MALRPYPGENTLVGGVSSSSGEKRTCLSRFTLIQGKTRVSTPKRSCLAQNAGIQPDFRLSTAKRSHPGKNRLICAVSSLSGANKAVTLPRAPMGRREASEKEPGPE
jgi:hypothetical protein